MPPELAQESRFQQSVFQVICAAGEVRSAMGAGIPSNPRDLQPFVGRGLPPRYKRGPAVQSAPAGGAQAAASSTWWFNLACRCRMFVSRGSDSSALARRLRRWFASAVPAPSAKKGQLEAPLLGHWASTLRLVPLLPADVVNALAGKAKEHAVKLQREEAKQRQAEWKSGSSVRAKVELVRRMRRREVSKIRP